MIPSFEAEAKSVLQMPDGRLLWALTQPIPGSFVGQSVQLLVSSDNGRTWPPHAEIMRDATAGIDKGDGHLIRRKNCRSQTDWLHGKARLLF